MATKYRLLPRLVILFTTMSILILYFQREEYIEKWKEKTETQLISASADTQKTTQKTIIQPYVNEPKNLSNGLVAFYPFMENPQDASRNKNDGRLIGVKLTRDRFGNPDNAYQFARNTFIEIKNSPSFQQIKDGVTAMAWINLSAYGGPRGIVSHDGKWVLGIYRGLLLGEVYLDNGQSIYLESSTGLRINQWYHVALSFDGQNLALFLNGQRIGLKSAPGKFHMKKPKNFRLYSQPAIGRAIGIGGESFIGIIDDVFIYSRALNGAEIKALINGELPET
jgi:hypothetical protein